VYLSQHTACSQVFYFTHLHRVLFTTFCVLLLCAGIANALKRNADIAQALRTAGTAAKLAVQRVAPVGHSKAPGNTGNSGDADGGEECSIFSCLKENALSHCPFSSIATASYCVSSGALLMYHAGALT
jgi:hypothetical protein